MVEDYKGKPDLSWPEKILIGGKMGGLSSSSPPLECPQNFSLLLSKS